MLSLTPSEPSFPRAAVDVPIELLMGGSSTRFPFPAPPSPPLRRTDSIALDSSCSTVASHSHGQSATVRRLFIVCWSASRPTPWTVLLIQFYDAVVSGLHKAYLDGRRTQLGIKPRLISKAKRQAVVQNDTDEQIDIMVRICCSFIFSTSMTFPISAN